MASLSYCTVPTNDVAKAKGFYDALLGSIGWGIMMELPGRGYLYGDGASMLGVFSPYDGNEASVGNGAMFGFRLETRGDVDAFHTKGLELGGTCEGPPGERGPGSYFAYFRDLEGNKLCAFALG